MKYMKKLTPHQFLLARRFLVNIFFLSLILYFLFHSIYGDRGIISYFQLQAKLNKSSEKLVTLRTERLEIENRAKLLRDSSIDRDMLDEKIRYVLGFSEPDEKVFRPASQ
jgi:cell division protein FtsB